MTKPLLIAALLSLAAAAPAQEPASDLTALKAALPGRLINDPSRLDWDVYGPGAASKPVRDPTAPGGGALQVTVPKKGATVFEIGTNAPLTAAVKAGETLVVSFYARTIKSDAAGGAGKIGVRFQQNAAPYPGFGDTMLDIGPEWKLYEVSATANRDIPAGQGVIGFQLSGAKQVVQIAQTIVVEGATSIVKAPPAPAGPATPLMPAQLAGKGELINDPATQNWDIYGAGESHERVPARGIAGDTALRFTIAAPGANPFDIGTNVPIGSSIAEGDVLVLAFFARTVSAATPDGLGTVTVRLQRNVAPYPGFGEHAIKIGPAWKLFQIRTQANIDIAKDEGVLAFHLAGAKQTVEIGRAYVLREPAP